MNFTHSAIARCAAVSIFAAVMMASPQFAAAQKDPLTGTWNFVPERSTAMPGPARYKNATLAFSASAQGEMTIDGVDAQGKPVKTTFDAVADGKPHPVTGTTDYDSGSWSRFNDATVTYSYTKRRTNMVLGSRTLSPDGNVLTFNEKIFDDKGKQVGSQVMVFAKPGFEIASATPSTPARAAAAAAPAAPPKATTADEDAGAAALAKGDADAAIAALTKALATKEKLLNPYYDYDMRGVAYLKKGMNDEALADFSEAIKLKSDDLDALLRRSNILLEKKQFDAAIADLSAIIKADDMNAAAYRLRGYAYFQLNQNVNGAADNDKACTLNKDLCVN
jgi:tetratricopeptide (TPR) repeat protein